MAEGGSQQAKQLLQLPQLPQLFSSVCCFDVALTI
jgi:hypothetical protein